MLEEIREMTINTKTETEIKVNELHTCCACGRKGTDMHRFTEYVGGQGLVEVWECNDCLEYTEVESRAAVQIFRAHLWQIKKMEMRRN